jgi:hypothetical protein
VLNRKRSGGLGQQICQSQVIRPAGFSEDFASATGASATLSTNTKLFAKLAHGVNAVVGGFANFPVGYTLAETNVHNGFLTDART